MMCFLIAYQSDNLLPIRSILNKEPIGFGKVILRAAGIVPPLLVP
jgi:hypothetical protein